MATPHDAEQTVEEFASRLLNQSYEDAVELLSEDGRTGVVDALPEGFAAESATTTEALDEFWRGLYAQYGAVVGVGSVAVEANDTEATVSLRFEHGHESLHLVVDADAVIDDLWFDPAYEVPAYVDEGRFSEHDVTVDAGDVALDGILTVPDGDGPLPGAILVHGAGVHDPDGTGGNSKLLKDLAWGLASEGIVSLRYEKRLASHDVADEELTIDRVVVNDAVAAVEELARTVVVDEDAVFVAGHSQGGTAAPRIADRHGGVAGVVVLDGLATPTHDPDNIAFLRYEMDPEGDLDEEQEAQLERERETVRRLAEGDYEDDETLWERPGVWHRSLLEYDPLATAERLDSPSFVLKTARADPETQAGLLEWLRGNYEDWRVGELPEGSRVELYRGLDHWFQRGPTPVSPLALYFGGNVDGDVVEDVVDWIRGVTAEREAAD